ncbi:MAG: response regulator [candidate division Zixibacteria bacterium]|nr:response regulator [candidate division Zixibacteria bacterium]
MASSDKKSILIVDDEEIIRDFLFEVLSEDFDISVACDGDEAIEKIGNNKYDLVITDLKMPRVSGEEVVKYAREQNPAYQVIIISGYSSLYAVSQSVNNGACAFLSKPFSISELMQTVSGCIAS